MELSACFSLAWRTLRRNGLRSALTLLGITIGVGAVLTMVAVGNGARASIEDQVAAAGMNVITVTAGNYKMKGEDPGGGVADHQAAWHGGGAADEDTPHSDRYVPAVFYPKRTEPMFTLISHPEDDPMEKHDHPTSRDRLGDSAAGLGAAATLTRADSDAIRQRVAGVQYVAAGVHESARVVLGDRRWFTRLHGTESDMPRIRRTWNFAYGRFFNDRESARGGQVIVLGSVVYGKLFPDGKTDPTGTTVTIWNQPFTVVGVLASTTWTSSGAVGDDEFDAVYVPLGAVHRLLNLSKLNTITVTAKSAAETTRVSKDVTTLLRARHQIAEAAPDDFVVKTQASSALGKGINPQVARAIAGNVPGLESVTLEQLSVTMERSSRTMTALLASVASVSLLVGGIGIMNVMLLSVTERTREIGIRMALGARGRDVMLQFMAEAVTLSLTGGVIGVVLGLIAAGSVRQMLKWATIISPGAILLAVGVAAAVGVFFGLYPARQASRLDPIDALRFE
ncbi:MAG TPA: ABC transporter permease [Vicinamibacterales bacterium]|nr:ABC transporter permease [Vicinamibacterales bacterium]